jgi:hypothetical protein
LSLKEPQILGEAWIIRRNDKTDTCINVLHEENCRIHPLGPQKKQRNYERITHSTNTRIYGKILKKLERACQKNECREDTQKDFKVSTKREKGFRKISEIMEELCCVMPISGLTRTTPGKDDDDILGDPDNFRPANPLVTPIHIPPEYFLSDDDDIFGNPDNFKPVNPLTSNPNIYPARMILSSC